MSNLKRYENNQGIEILIDETTGESFASISGYARMANKAQSTISERIGKLEVKEAQILTTTGLKTHRLIDENLICEWIIKDNPTVATALLKLGVRKFLHDLAGYKVEQASISSHEANINLASILGDKIEAKFTNKGIGKQLSIKALALAVPPIFLPILEEAKLEIAKENAISGNELFTATNIAEILTTREGLEEFNTARKVNKLLENLGLQTKGRKNWIATSKAKKLNLATELEIVASLDQKNSKWAGVQLRWKDTVIDYIIDEYYDYQAM